MATHVNHTKDPLGPFLFVVNPNSGTGAVHHFRGAIKAHTSNPEITIIESESGQHAQQLAREAYIQGYKSVIAVGGDGSVHEVAVNLIGSSINFGIIPIGSGNGVARHLGISTSIQQAIEQVLHARIKVIDTFKLNQSPGIGFCGVGIDAKVAKDFDEAGKRGFSNYVKLTIDTFINYRPTHFTIKTTEGDIIETEAYSVVVANTSQFGNDAFINPKGKDNDGLLDVIIIKNLPKAAFVTVASRLFLKTITASKWVYHLQTKQVEIINHGNAYHQIDGEPYGQEKCLNFEVIPRSLNTLIP